MESTPKNRFARMEHFGTIWSIADPEPIDCQRAGARSAIRKYVSIMLSIVNPFYLQNASKSVTSATQLSLRMPQFRNTFP
jgi:hypothetical protein